MSKERFTYASDYEIAEVMDEMKNTFQKAEDKGEISKDTSGILSLLLMVWLDTHKIGRHLEQGLEINTTLQRIAIALEGIEGTLPVIIQQMKR